jgi:hypothetical protein
LYPAPWRHRYGEEFLALLEDRPPRGLQLVDVVWGALDAHLFPQAPEGRFRMFTRIAGIAALLAGVAILMGFLFFIPNVNEYTVPAFYGLATVGLVGIHLRQVSVRPGLAWLGFLLALLGLVSGIGFVVLTRIGVIPTSGGELGWLAGIALWIGSSALGAVMLATRVFPISCGLAFAIGSPIAMIGLVAGSATLSGGVLDILGQVGIVIYALGWLGIGWSLLTSQPQEGVLGAAA